MVDHRSLREPSATPGARSRRSVVSPEPTGSEVAVQRIRLVDLAVGALAAGTEPRSSRPAPCRCCGACARRPRPRPANDCPARVHMRRAARVVPEVVGDLAGDDEDQARSRMRVPARRSANVELVVDHVEVREPLGAQARTPGPRGVRAVARDVHWIGRQRLGEGRSRLASGRVARTFAAYAPRPATTITSTHSAFLITPPLLLDSSVARRASGVHTQIDVSSET